MALPNLPPHPAISCPWLPAQRLCDSPRDSLTSVPACRRFRDHNYEELEALDLGHVRDAVMALLHPENLEVNIVGDFEPQELEHLLLNYLGTVAPLAPFTPPVTRPIQLLHPPSQERRISWHLQDSDDRACAYMAGES